MKILIFSDTHLTEKFDPEKYKFLKKIIQPADKIFILGDFWDGYLTSFEKFINSRWRSLFPDLQKKTVYLFGNHDPKKLSDKRIKLFCKRGNLREQIKAAGKTIYLEHGNRLLPLVDDHLHLDPEKKSHLRLLKYGQILLNKLINLKPEIFQQTYFRKKTLELKNKIKAAKDELYIFGHTHCPMLDLEKGFGNTGFINYGLASYITIEKSQITLHKGRYR